MGKIHTHVIVEGLTNRGRELLDKESTSEDGALMLMAAAKLREHGRTIISLREQLGRTIISLREQLTEIVEG